MSMISFVCEICGKGYRGHHSRTENTHTCSRKCANKRMLKNIDDKEIVRLYWSGKSSIEIGKQMGVSWTTIVRRLRKNGISLRSRTAHLFTDKNPTKGKGHSEATKKKIRAAQKRQFSDPKMRELASHNQCLYLAKNLVANVSGVEDRVASEMDRKGIPYQRQVPIRNPKNGRYGACVDFLVKGVAVEVNGTYWHSDPRVYPDGPIFVSQKRTASNYQKKTKLLRLLGIRLVEVWEIDIDKDISRAVGKAMRDIGDIK